MVATKKWMTEEDDSLQRVHDICDTIERETEERADEPRRVERLETVRTEPAH